MTCSGANGDSCLSLVGLSPSGLVDLDRRNRNSAVHPLHGFGIELGDAEI
jgi:hypothetical protein